MARPRLYGKDPIERTSIRLRAGTKDKLAQLAERRGHPVSRVLPDLVELYVAAHVADFVPRLLLPGVDSQPTITEFEQLYAAPIAAHANVEASPVVDATVIVDFRLRARTKELVTALAAARGHAVSPLVADLVELYVAARDDGFTADLQLPHADSQPVIDDLEELLAA